MVFFPRVAGSTSFFGLSCDPAGLAMILRHDELASGVFLAHGGRVVKTIGDSAMAEVPDAGSAGRAGVGNERHVLKVNSALPGRQRVELRIGIPTGVGFRRGKDVFWEVVYGCAR